MAEWRDTDTVSVSPQRRFRVWMETTCGGVGVTLQASTIEAVIDQVKGRRIATPPEMTGFTVAEIEPR